MARRRNRSILLILCLALLVITLEAPLGDYLGVFNWTEYVRKEFVIGGGKTEYIRTVTLAPLDSLSITVAFESPPYLVFVFLVSANVWKQEAHEDYGRLGELLATENWPTINEAQFTNPSSHFQIHYTTLTGGDFLLLANGMGKERGGGDIRGNVMVTVSRLYLALIPAFFLVSSIIFVLRNRRTHPTLSPTAPRQVPAQRFCMNCGAPLRASATYCTKCGSKQ